VISKALSEILDKYLLEKQKKFAGNEFASFVRRSSSELIKPTLGNLADSFLFKSSSGQMNTWADVPWIAVMDPDVTTSTQSGYDVVYLFSVDMKRVYLSLNQGVTYIRQELGKKNTLKELSRRAAFIRERVTEYKEFFSDDPINLSSNLSKSERPELYEPGHAFGKEYLADNLPSEEVLLNDLKNILELYLSLTHRGGLDTELSGSDYEPDFTKDNDLEERRRYVKHRRIERNSKNAREVKKIRGYICEACGFDFESFYGKISFNKKNEKFIEAHHLVPLSNLPEGKPLMFNAKEDFRVLCSNCHRMVHRKNPPYTIEELKSLIKI